MKSVLHPINSSLFPDSPALSVIQRHDSFSGYEKVEISPLLHLNMNNRRRISRAISETQTISRLKSINAGSQTFPEMLPDEEDVSRGIDRIGSMKFAEKCLDRMSEIPIPLPAGGIAQFTGIGSGIGRDRNGFDSGRSSNNEGSKICAHYQKLLELNPNDPLVLRNYGKFLHEVGDAVQAEEYYGRAILANPGDGELLSLFGKLVWDAQRDGERARSYFDQAISASPDDCMVLGSYAQFMWYAEEEDYRKH